MRDFGKFLSVFLKTLGVLILLGLYGYWGYNTLSSLNSEKRIYVKCGFVKNKVNETTGDGDYTNTKLYLGIQYDDGTFEAEEMGPKTFLLKEKGDRICINHLKELSENQSISNTFFFICTLILGMLLLGKLMGDL